MSEKEIRDLVELYNEVEQDQHERLTRLFDLLNARKGYRFVDFGGRDSWSNFWGRDERPDLAKQSFINRMVRKITKIVIGEEG